jgi:hypothetical protein
MPKKKVLFIVIYFIVEILSGATSVADLNAVSAPYVSIASNKQSIKPGIPIGK